MIRLRLFVAAGTLVVLAGVYFAFFRAPANDNPMTFFVASTGLGSGANLGGLEGADAHCQALAEAVGAGGREWRAYLSTQERTGQPAIHARERIGAGPWVNAQGAVVAENVEALHGAGNAINKKTALNEKGEEIGGESDPEHPFDTSWTYMQANPRSIRHEILTGSTAEGRAFEDGRDHTCNNWTSEAEGNSPGRARFNTGPGAEIGKSDATGSWNSHGISGGCSNDALARSHGAGLFYCFAAN
jgi:hypothetical protein